MSNTSFPQIDGVTIFTIISGFCLGVPGALCNILVIAVIVTSKPLRRPGFQLIAGGSFGALTVSIACLCNGIDKLKTFLNLNAAERTGLQCLLSGDVVSLFGIPYHALVTCLIGIDRLISLTAPIRYRNFGRKYVIYLLSLTALFVIILEVLSFATALLDKNVKCSSFVDALDPVVFAFLAIMNLFYCVAIVFIYATVLACFYYKRRKLQKGSASNYQQFMKLQSTIMPTVKLLMLLYLLFGIIPEFMINIAVQLEIDQSIASIVLLCAVNLKYPSSFVEVISLTISCKKFRQCLKNKVFPCASNAVGPNG